MKRLIVLSLSLVLALGFGAAQAGAGFPAAYNPSVVMPAGTPERYEFDLSEALKRAAAQHKRLYVYLGADNCPFCRRYEAFLSAHAAELAPEFARNYLVIDLRSTLSAHADRVRFKIGDKSLAYAEFMHQIGDERERQLVYPSVWLLDDKAHPLMQMPAGTGTFETVDEQIDILRLAE